MWRGGKRGGLPPSSERSSSPSPHFIQTYRIRQSLMHEAFRRIGGVEDDDALGVVGGPELEPFPDAGVERHLLGFETPLFFGEAQLRVAAAGAFQRIGGVHVEHKGPVGPEAADGHVVERAQFFDVEAAP